MDKTSIYLQILCCSLLICSPINSKAENLITANAQESISENTGILKPDEPSNQSLSPEVNYQSIKEIFSQGDISKAKELAENYLQTNPKDGDVRLLLAKIYLEEKELALAERALLQILQEYPKYMDARLILANVRILNKNNAAALETINQGLALEPTNSDLLAKKTQLQNLMRPNVPTTIEESPKLITAKIQEELQPKSTPKYSYEDIKSQFDQGNINIAKNMALKYLAETPKDADVRFILARVYNKQQLDNLAIKELLIILESYPKYKDVRLQLINIYFAQQNYIQALPIINEGLVSVPNDEDLLLKKAQYYYLTKQYSFAAALLKKIIAANPLNLDAEKMLSDIRSSNPQLVIGRNQIGIWQGLYKASDQAQLWDFSSLYYTRDVGDYGSITASLNYAARMGFKATQGQLEAYPRLSKYLYLDLLGAYANNPNLFPNYTLGGEAYFSIPSFLDPSMGATYRKITDQQNFMTYTCSLAKMLGPYWLSFRPYYFVPNAGESSILYNITMRRYFNDAGDFYFGISLSSGYSPDLYDLESVNFIVTRNNIGGATLEFPLFAHHLIVDLNGSFQRQAFPNSLVRNISGGTLGLRYRF